MATAVLAFVSLSVLLGDADTASRSRVAASTYVYVVAMVALVVFAAAFGRLVVAPDRSWVGLLLVALGASDATLQVVSVMPRAALNHRQTLLVDEATARVLLDVGLVTNYGSDIVLAAFVGLAGVALWGHGGPVARWLAGLAVVDAPCALVAAAARGGVAGAGTYWLLLVWLVAVGVAALRGAFDAPAPVGSTA